MGIAYDEKPRATSPAVTRVIDGTGTIALMSVAAAWLVVLARVLRHRIFISHDTMISYAHVWYVSDRLWHGHGLPLHMPMLGHGKAYAFPYGFVPWTTAALFRPLLGDWVVTLWLVLGAVGVVAATLWAFPELRRGWWATAVLLNPALVTGELNGQLPFLWASALLIAAIGCWRRDRRVAAIVLAALAQATHPAVMLPIAAAIVAGWVAFEPDRRALLRAYGLSLLPALPAALIVLRSPVFVDSSVATKFGNFVGTVGPRCLIFAVPILLVAARDRLRTLGAPAVVVALVAANIVMGPPLGMPWAWRALNRWPVDEFSGFLDSPAFVPGATYRLLLTLHGKLGEYQMIERGGRLDSEFFPESMAIRSWPNLRVYSEQLRRRDVDFVMAFPDYDHAWHTNEHALLDQLARVPASGCAKGLVATTRIAHNRHYDLYRVDRSCGSRAAP